MVSNVSNGQEVIVPASDDMSRRAVRRQDLIRW